MANYYRQLESPIRRTLIKLLALMLATGFTAATAAAEPEAGADESAKVLPYKATYGFKAVGLNFTVTRELRPGKGDEWVLTQAGKILVAGIQETAIFSMAGADIQPKSYVYQGTGMINRRREVHFDGSDTIRSLYKDEWYELPYTDGTLDRMTQQEQLRFTLINDPTPKEDVSVRVADGKRIKDYQLRYVGEEVLKTKLGQINTLHFERVHDDDDRRSGFWVAPEWDYLMVKTVHVEDGKENEAVITGATINGRKL